MQSLSHDLSLYILLITPTNCQSDDALYLFFTYKVSNIFLLNLPGVVIRWRKIVGKAYLFDFTPFVNSDWEAMLQAADDT